MLERSDITDDEFVFLFSQKILVAQLYDARGNGPTSFREQAKELGLLFGMANPCKNGHRLFTRAGHCIQCNTSRIAHIRNYSDSGYVYIAASPKGRFLKIGSTSKIQSRSSTLNTEGGYAGFSDWEVIAYSKFQKKGPIEFEMRRLLRDLAVEKTYIRAGKTQIAHELLKGNLRPVWKVYNDLSDKSAERWQHLHLKTFDYN